MLRTAALVFAMLLCSTSCATSTEVNEEPVVVSPTMSPIATIVPTGTPEVAPPASAVPSGLRAYEGLGAWVDVFDWAPVYAGPDGPPITPDDLTDMAEMGVTTLYLQTSRLDEVGTGPIESPELITEFLRAAHEQNMAVVGWFLPRWEDAGEDLARLIAIGDFNVDGQQFDGIGVDIEGVPKVDQRSDWNSRLIELSKDLRGAAGSVPIGAIVLPPTLLEVVNVEYWPDFPWGELAPLYDVWLPMSYWSFRSDDSPFANGYSYNADATARLRHNLGDPDALVHAIGGIGAVLGDDELATTEPRATAAELDGFVRSLVDTRAIGGSIYDWASMEPAGREAMTSSMRAANLLAD